MDGEEELTNADDSISEGGRVSFYSIYGGSNTLTLPQLLGVSRTCRSCPIGHPDVF